MTHTHSPYPSSPAVRERARCRSLRPGVLGLLALLALPLAGCLAVPPVLLTHRALSEKEPSGDELKQLQQESAAYRKKGTGTIAGTVAMSSDGQTVPASEGTSVFLTPITTYATQRMQKYAVEDNEIPAKANAQVYWVTHAQDGGRFSFRNLPPGDYYVVSQMFWSPPAAGSQPRGDVAYGSVHLEPGESLNILLTRPPPPR